MLEAYICMMEISAFPRIPIYLCVKGDINKNQHLLKLGIFLTISNFGVNKSG